MEEPLADAQALETRRARILALFEARMGRWQPVQSASFALVTVALAGFLSHQVPFPLLLTVLVIGAGSIAISAGAQDGYQVSFRREMQSLEKQFERLKRGRSNL